MQGLIESQRLFDRREERAPKREAETEFERPERNMIAAKVTVKTATACYIYDALNRSVDAISQEAEKLAGDEPFGLTILVLQ